MEFLELAKRRRSIREFTDEDIKEEELDLILETALLAPSGMNRKPCEFIIIKDKENLKNLSQIKTEGAEFLEKANLAIAVIVDSEYAKNTHIQDASIAAAYIQLAAADLGLGSCWAHITGGVTKDGIDSHTYINKFLNIPQEYIVNCIIGIGHIGGEPLLLKPKDLWKNIHHEKF